MNDSPKKAGRKPKGDRAMTSAERKRAYRERQKQNQMREATFMLQEGDLAELKGLAESYSTTSSELLGGIIGGQMRNLKQLDEALRHIEGDVERVSLYKHKALELIYNGLSITPLLEHIVEERAQIIERLSNQREI